MNAPADLLAPRRPALWSLVLAFALVYLSWGTTYLAIKEGVKNQHLPPALFGGVRVFLAGVALLAFLAWRGQGIRLGRGDLLRVAVGGGLLFVAGNGLLTFAERSVPSGEAAVIAATAPLWIGVFSMFWPGGERLAPRGWTGLGLGLAGVLFLMVPQLSTADALFQEGGAFLVLGSACSWGLGSVWIRHCPARSSHWLAAAYQMILGGAGLSLIGVALGEPAQLTAGHFTWAALVPFAYLFVVGSLVGFVAYNWLLRHVSAAHAGTTGYVNPVVAVLVGWLLGNEELTGWVVGGMLIILAGVALVRSGITGGKRPEVGPRPPSPRPRRVPAGLGTLTKRCLEL
jgi:drug/metabolite transporter (DMT)-like permease